MSRRLVHLITIVLVAGFVPTSLGDVLDPSLAAWWRFDEGAGTLAADASGHGRDGTLVFDPVWRDDGPRGGCLFFDGAYAYVRVIHDDSLNPQAGDFTVTFWANVDPTPGTTGDTTWDLAVGKRDTGSVGYYVGALRTQGSAAETGYRFMLGDTAATRTDTPFVLVPLGEWVFVAAVLNRGQNVQKISVDGGQTWATTAPPAGVIAPAQDLSIGWDIGPNNYWFHGMIDDVALFGRALSDGQVKLIMEKGMTPALANNPYPKDRAVDVPADVVLRWEPGLYAATHDVYVGTTAADVGTATRANPLGLLVSKGQSETQCALDNLAFGQTLFWRVDEVNAPPDSTVFPGEVWRFKVEPRGYELAAEHIVATASSSNSAEEGPANTIGGVGLDAADLHSTSKTAMWLSGAVAAGESAWIQYEFDKVYALHQMAVWNHNAETESLVGFGIQEAAVEYSLDGNAWTRLGDVHTFAQAPGKDGYASDTTIDFRGMAARYVRITALSNWKGLLPQYGLSEVRFLYIPLRAREPVPAADTNDLPPELTLSWRPGRQAVRHDVYLSSDPQAVADGTAPVVAVSEPTFDPGALNLGQSYFWKVNEVNEAAAVPVWEGDVWRFRTQEFLVVEDFESYTDYEGSLIYDTWIDGWENETGAQVGYLDPPFAERTIVHGGAQSMPLVYNNAVPLARSEAERTFDEPQDWTVYGIGTLTLYFRGALDNAGQMYVKINNTKVPYNGDAGDLARMVWQPWNVDLSGINSSVLRSVSKLTIGIEGADATGTLYFDDIRLYPKGPESTTSVEPNRANLLAYYSLDGNVDDSSANGYHGVAVGEPTYGAGVLGPAMEFDGFDDHVRITHQDKLNPGTGSFTITCWARVDPEPGLSGNTDWDLAVAKREASSARGYYLGAQRSQGDASQTGWKFMLGDTSSKRVDTPFVLVPLGEWVFAAGVLDRAQNVHKISVDGGLTWATATPPAGPIAPATDLAIGWDIGQNNYWFHGTIDEVRLYDTALTDEEIAWLAGGR
jgi:hypothetical protein